MQLIQPDIIASARGLSTGAAGFFLLVGICLWALGWRWHRFWVVFSITLVAGLLGLTAGRNTNGQVLLLGILLAVTAGLLALELARILAFITGGSAAWMATQLVLPQAQELWAAFLSGGLLGIVLYQLWTMLLTSFVGVVVSTHAGILLAEHFAKLDGIKLLQEKSAALNGIVLALTVIGLLLQVVTSPSQKKADSDESKDASQKVVTRPEKKEATEEEEMEPAQGWWRKFFSNNRAA